MTTMTIATERMMTMSLLLNQTNFSVPFKDANGWSHS